MTWEPQDLSGKTENAVSGELVIGSVGVRDDGNFWWRMHVVRCHPNSGTVASRKTAKAAVERQWRAFCKYAGLKQ